MDIVPYDEVDPDSVARLNWTAFRWLPTPDLVAELVARDRWLPERFALYAAEDGQALAQVGMVAVDTEMEHGNETVGFVWGVCTMPQVARQGLATALVEETHSLMRDDGIRYSVLGTMRSFVAHALYHRLGYVEMLELSSAMRRGVPSSTPGEEDIDVEEGATDAEMDDLFGMSTEGLLGFVNRQPGIARIHEANFHDGPYGRGTFRRRGETIGNAVWKASGTVLNVLDVTCADPADAGPCISSLERRLAPATTIFCWSSRKAVLDSLSAAGFVPIRKVWGVLMVKDLEGRHGAEDVLRLYGAPEDRFQMGALDEY